MIWVCFLNYSKALFWPEGIAVAADGSADFGSFVDGKKRGTVHAWDLQEVIVTDQKGMKKVVIFNGLMFGDPGPLFVDQTAGADKLFFPAKAEVT